MTRRQALALLVQAPQFRTSTQLVVVPLTVMDGKGERVGGLRAADFEVLDQGRAREFQLEDSNAPLSLVVAVETAGDSWPALEKIRKTAALFEPLLAGHDGEVGLISYDDEVRVLAALSRDAKVFDAQLRGLQVGGGAGKMHDAVGEAVRMLRERSAERRRVLLLIGESKDLGSKLKLDEAVGLAQQANVSVYPVTYSRTTTAFATKEQVRGTKPGVDLLGALRELGRLGQANSAAELAKFTGGWSNSFTKLRGLEEALQRVGAELHLQYVLTFEARGVQAGEYRQIQVRVKGAGKWTVRHRPGYWIESEEIGKPAGL